MAKRREFPRSVRIAVIKRAGASGMIICEKCGNFARRFQVDHVVADSHGGEPTLENAMLICEDCFAEKNATDTTIAAKLKRVEARHIGASRPAGTIKSRGFAKSDRAPKRLSAGKQCAGPSAFARQIVTIGE